MLFLLDECLHGLGERCLTDLEIFWRGLSDRSAGWSDPQLGELSAEMHLHVLMSRTAVKGPLEPQPAVTGAGH